MMTTNGKMPWRECFRESWKSCREAGPNYTMYLIFGIVVQLLRYSYIRSYHEGNIFWQISIEVGTDRGLYAHEKEGILDDRT